VLIRTKVRATLRAQTGVRGEHHAHKENKDKIGCAKVIYNVEKSEPKLHKKMSKNMYYTTANSTIHDRA
jgi:hypothetical protein